MSKHTLLITNITEDTHAFNFVLGIKDLKTNDHTLDFAKDGMKCTGNIHWLGDRLKLIGNYLVNCSKSCDRCLEKAQATAGGSFELYLLPLSESQETEDREIFIADPDIDYFEDDIIDLSAYFESQFFLDLPEVFICSENCKGICPYCGSNKNKHMCDCEYKTGNYPFKFVFK